MVHLIVLCKRKPDMGKIQFHRHWRDVHSQLFARMPGVRRYVQNHFFLKGLETEPLYDGVADIWLDSEDAYRELFSSPAFIDGVYSDLPHFLVPEQITRLLTEDHVLLEGAAIARHAPMAKGFVFLKRKPGMEVEDFRRYWRDVHGRIVLGLPNLRRYVQCHVLSSAYAHGEPLHDGIEQLWFDNGNALREAMNSLVWWLDLHPSIARFVDEERLVSLVAEEYRVVCHEG